MLKKIISITTGVTILVSSTAVVFAGAPDYNVEKNMIAANSSLSYGLLAYELQSNKFRNETVETDYKYYQTSTMTEDDIARALQVASTELNVLGYFAAGVAAKPIVGAVQVGKNIAKSKLLEIVRRQMGIMGTIEIVERTSSAGLTWWEFKAEQRVTEVKYTYRYQVNMLTNQRTLTSTTATYKINIYRRDSASSPWQFITTEVNSSTY